LKAPLIATSYLLDLAWGDPEWFPHPVRGMGKTIEAGEKTLRWEGQTSNEELLCGAALTFALVGASYFLTAKTIDLAYRTAAPLSYVIETLLGWTCLASRSLQQEAESVLRALEVGDIVLARKRLARIVGRDTYALSEQEICRAVIETLAESASDGIIAPLFYMALGGVPLAMAYKAVNTLDSMIGHADERYLYFGRVAARLDDAANYLPARLTALGLISVSSFIEECNPQTACQTWLRDGAKHKSPNAGQPESAMSGALRVQLGGENSYGGEIIPALCMGQEYPAASLSKAERAVRLVAGVSLLGLAAAALLTEWIRRRSGS